MSPFYWEAPLWSASRRGEALGRVLIAPNKPIHGQSRLRVQLFPGLLSFEENEVGIFEMLDYHSEKTARFDAVDYSVIESEGKGHDFSHDDMSISNDGSILDLSQSQDGDLGIIDNRGAVRGADHARSEERRVGKECRL